MNKQRRKDLDDALKLISDARNIVENARDEEQEYFDNMPESFQFGDKGQDAEAAASNLDEAVNAFDEIESYISEAQG